LTEGTTYTLTARITDAAGNQSAVSTNSFTVTESAPEIFRFTGTIYSVDPQLTSKFAVGDTISGTYTFDPAALDVDPADPTVGIYNSTLAYSVTAGSFSSTGTGFAFNIFDNLVLASGALRDQYRVALGSTGPSVNGLSYNGFSLDLLTTLSDPVSLTSDALPVTPPTISNFQSNQLRFYFIDPNNTTTGVDYVIGSLSTLTFAGYVPVALSITSMTDNAAPVTGSLVSGASTNDPDPTVRVSLSGTGALAGEAVRLYNGTDTNSPLGSSYTLTSTDISNGFANVQTGTLTNGSTYTLTARITDAAGNQSAVSTNSFTVTEDTTQPAVTESLKNDTGASWIDKITRDASLAGSGDANAVVHFAVDGSPIANTATADGSGAWTFVPMGLSDGQHTIVASETDPAGNNGTTSLTFKVDTIANAPGVALANDTGTSNSDKITQDPALTLTGVETGAIVQYSLDATHWSTTAPTIASLAQGSDTVLVRQTDLAGNVSSATSFTFTLIIPTVIESSGSTSLTEVGNNFYLGGSGPELKYAGSAVVAGQFGAYTPIGAEQTASGYDIAWKMPGADQYTFWSTDGSGNFISNLTGGAVSGSSSALESLETIFHQDLNGDGAAGLYAKVLDGHLGGQTLTASGGGPTALIGGPNDILNAGAGADTFVFRPNLGSNTINGFVAGTDSIQFDHAVFADYAAVQSHMQQVGSDVVIAQDAQDLVTLHNVLISNLHASDFQFT
jgi:Bacterial Ig-like domain/Tryptophan-rich Synechocystis species C-terminal domain